MQIFIDTSLFLEYILPSPGYGRTGIEKDFRRTVEDARRKGEPELVTSHVVLGEVIQVLHETADKESEKKILFDLRKVFDLDTYQLSSPEPESFSDSLKEVIRKDGWLSHNDSIILAQAVSERVDVVKATDRDWSSRLEDLGIELEISGI